MSNTVASADCRNALRYQWDALTAVTGKDAVASALAARRIGAERSKCWQNARRAVMELEDYAVAGYVEGIIGLDQGLLLEHGWICRADGTVIDPTLPAGVAAYFPGLEFSGREGIAAFLATSQGKECVRTPFHYAFGFGGSQSPGYQAAWQAALNWHRARS